MKIIILILSLFLYSCAIRIPEGSTPDDNSAIIEFVEKNINKKVGKGICFDLVRKAVEKKNKRWYKNVWCDRKQLKMCKTENPVAGDIIDFSKVVMKDGRKIFSHIGVVSSFSRNVVIYYEQNVCGSKSRKPIRYHGKNKRVCKNSAVQKGIININLKIKGKITFYHF